MKLRSGATTGERCVCGAPVYAYYTSRVYRPDEPMPPLDALPMHWEFVCEWGHRQIGPVAQLRQSSLLDEYVLEV